MSDDEPPSKNPFIRFKQHVDSRIGSGLSVLTGASKGTEPATTSPASSDLPRPPNATMSSGTPSPSANSSSWIDSLLGQDRKTYHILPPNATVDSWKKWAQSSPYSPHNLAHLNPPVPAGGSEEDAHCFGFDDAFEDLLAVTQGKPLMDLRQHADYKRSIRDGLRMSETPEFWVNRLWRRGLLPVEQLHPEMWPEAKQKAYMNRRKIDHIASDYEELAQHKQRESLDKILAQTQKMCNAVAGDDRLMGPLKGLREQLLKELDQDVTFNPATILRQMEESAKQIAKETGFDPTDLARQIEEMLSSVDKAMAKVYRQAEQVKEDSKVANREFDLEKFLQGDERSKHVPKAQDQQKPQPDTEQDFFSAIFGALMEANASFKPPRERAANASHDKGEGDLPRPFATPMYEECEQEDINEHGGKTVSRSLHTRYPSGATQTRTEVRTLDAQGNELSRKTEVVDQKPELAKPSKTPLEEYQDQLRLLMEKNNQRLEMLYAERDGQSSEQALAEPKALKARGDGNSSDGEQTRGEPIAKSGKSTGWFWT